MKLLEEYSREYVEKLLKEWWKKNAGASAEVLTKQKWQEMTGVLNKTIHFFHITRTPINAHTNTNTHTHTHDVFCIVHNHAHNHTHTRARYSLVTKTKCLGEPTSRTATLCAVKLLLLTQNTPKKNEWTWTSKPQQRNWTSQARGKKKLTSRT